MAGYCHRIIDRIVFKSRSIIASAHVSNTATNPDERADDFGGERAF
jgi:hypothetical protein